MTNPITLAKEQFRDALIASSLDVKEYIPERIIPPVVVISDGSPFLEPESLSQEFIMNLELLLVAGTASNETSTEELESLISTALNGLPAYARIVNVGKPYALAVNNTEYLSASLFVEISITI